MITMKSNQSLKLCTSIKLKGPRFALEQNNIDCNEKNTKYFLNLERKHFALKCIKSLDTDTGQNN